MTETALEIVKPDHCPHGTIRVAIFDFDGTFSTLRCGWEKVMRPLMLEYISGGQAYDSALEEKIDAYIDSSTGIQTVYQMQWLAEQVEAAGFGRPERDAWWYKDEYNRRLMEQVSARIAGLESGEDKPEQYLVAGAVEFLKALKQAGVEVYLASGTDHKDVVHEASVLGVVDYFTEIKGAPERKAACSKEAVLKRILEEKNLPGECLLLVGDGKVEIALGADCGAYTLGAATNEEELHGVNPVKRERLLKAGADVIVGDFTNLEGLMAWLDLKNTR
ncbi:MAG: HAD family hydrolase [Lachnospiraceae bacterium]|nr:HAD family hydrolase [Lachnospiraceae bacterium]